MKGNLKLLIDTALKKHLKNKLNEYKLNQIDPLLARGIREFVLRPGKRIRPLFFLLSYLGYSRKKTITDKLLITALAFELLHDFLLIHDDVIDNSPTRRGKPALHKVFQHALRQTEKIGQDLSIVAGDIIYAFSIDAFLKLPAKQANQEAALRAFLSSTVLTGAGEFKDIRNGLTRINRIELRDIRLNYLLKTAEYTFKAPLVCGCLLAGRTQKEAGKIANYGLLLGEAFQIHDDLIGLFGKSAEIGKSVLSDIIEAKKTLPIFLAYKNSSCFEQKFITYCLGNKKLKFSDLQRIRKIVTTTGARDDSKKQINRLLTQADNLLYKSALDKKYKQLLHEYLLSFIKN